MIDGPQILRPFDATEAITIAEAARIAGTSAETIRRWVFMHDLGRKIGGRWRLSRAALQMHLNGDKAALRALLSGDRVAPEVLPYFGGVERRKNLPQTPQTPQKPRTWI